MNTVLQQDIPDQVERLQALDPQHSFIIQAPAGSGKTGLLTQRFLVLLATVDEPEEIIAITFTRKAASEMKHRILQALRAAADEREVAKDAYQRQLRELANRVLAHDQARGWQLLQNPSRLRIRTIDSLCAWLVDRMPVCSRQGALSSVAEDADRLYLEAARLTVEALEEEGEWTAAIEHLIGHLDNRLDRLQQLIADMLARRDLWLHGVVDAANSDGMRDRLESVLSGRVAEAIERLADAVPAGCQPEIIELMQFAAVNLSEAESADSNTVHWPGNALEDRLAWESIADFLLTQTGDWRKQVTKANGFPAPSSVRDADVKEYLNGMKQRMSELLAALQNEETFRQQLCLLRQLPPERYTDEEWETLQALFSLLKVAAGYLLLVFRQHGQVDFSEIAMAAVRALGEPETPTDLALALDYRIRHILVDEFQDTSSNQAELLQRLTAGWQTGDGRTLFLVGDPMQSIYRFRQAEVGLFLDIRDSGCFGQIQMKFLRLSVNFRSQGGIVDWVNRYFPQILPDTDKVDLGAVSYAPSVASHAASGQEAVRVYPCLQRDDPAEAKQVVAIIEQARATRPNGRTAVLVRNRSHLVSIVASLRQKKLRFQAVEIEQLAQRAVIRDLMVLTRALVHPADRIAWLALLRAPFCGLSLQDLHTVANTLPQHVLIDALRTCAGSGVLSEEGGQRVNRVLPVLECALTLYDRMSLRRCVEGAWTSLGGPACVQDETDLADAEVYFQLLENFDVIGYRPDIQELDERLIQLFALPDVAADDSLQLMTLHKAKGLEFDTVILPGLGKSPRGDQEKLLNWLVFRDQSRQSALLCAPISAAGGEKNPISAYILSEEKKRTALEEARLLYVAVTRAKHSLHLLGHLKADSGTLEGGDRLSPPSDTLLAKLWPAVAADFQKRLRETGVENLPVSNGRASSPLFVSRKRLVPAWQPPPLPEAVAVAMHAHEAGMTEEPVDFDWAGEPARLVGVVVHRLLHRIGLAGIENINQQDLDGFIQTGRSLLMQSGIAPQDLETAVQQITKTLRVMCVEDETGRWILSSRHQEAHCEWALLVAAGGSTSISIIDRTFVDTAGVRWVIDYKTGSHSGGGLEEFLDREQQRYRPQLERYAQALQRMENRPIRLAIYFPLLGKWREWILPRGSV
ncbi:UvrD-helicase domain-containing protein [Nitrosomonas sp.]|uniref:UvrD-helicase domain-containing protein n=1 Tax=Nitrosomonas sp. TaxID=42353 RepID=UPI0025D76A94|nr:UvrD-helicase domain-containing protein [Nitrosomonas sp.]MCC6916311.1 UvrD-helicase domain-containing protein [Nitrosomonas sp.]